MPEKFENSVAPPHYQPSTEIVPNYTPAIEYVGIVMIENELLTPYDISVSQRWVPRILELNSTQVNIYEIYCVQKQEIVKNEFSKLNPTEAERSLDIKNKEVYNPSCNDTGILKFTKLFRKQERNDETYSSESEMISNLLNNFNELESDEILHDQSAARESSLEKLKGKLVGSYTLQRSQIGSASDYLRKPFVLRLRAEMEQMIIQTPNFKEFINWYWKISTCANLSLPLESRVDLYKTLPPHPSYRNSLRRPSIESELLPSSLERDSKEMLGSERSISECDLPELIDTMSNYVEYEDRLSLLLFGEDEINKQSHYQYLQLMLMSRCIRPLTMRNKWEGKSVVVYDSLPQIDGYTYDISTYKLLPKSLRSERKNQKSIEVKLVRHKHLSKYLDNINKGKIPKVIGDEYFISSSGLVHPC